MSLERIALPIITLTAVNLILIGLVIGASSTGVVSAAAPITITINAVPNNIDFGTGTTGFVPNTDGSDREYSQPCIGGIAVTTNKDGWSLTIQADKSYLTEWDTTATPQVYVTDPEVLTHPLKYTSALVAGPTGFTLKQGGSIVSTKADVTTSPTAVATNVKNGNKVLTINFFQTINWDDPGIIADHKYHVVLTYTAS